MGWTAATSSIVFGLMHVWLLFLSVIQSHTIQRFGMLRIAAAVERAGLDLHVHQETAYDHSATGHAPEGMELGQIASSSSISTMASALMPSEVTDESNF